MADKSYILQLRRKAKDQRDKKLKAMADTIEAEYQADLASIDRLADLMAETSAKPDAAPRGESVETVGPAAATREAIRSQRGEFTINDLDRHVRQTHPNAGVAKAGISSALSKMIGKEARLVRQGKGREASVYRRIVSEDGEEEQPRLMAATA